MIILLYYIYYNIIFHFGNSNILFLLSENSTQSYPLLLSSTINNISNNYLEKSYINYNNIDKSFLEWFSGFTDAEGNFSIFEDNKYIRFRFKLVLHKDDINILYKIKNSLEIGNIYIENKNYCSYVVNSLNEIIYLSTPPLGGGGN